MTPKGPAPGAIERRALEGPTPYANDARTDTQTRIEQFAATIRRHGVVNPVLVGDGGETVTGHGRVAAARTFDMTEVPTLRLAHPSAAKWRACALAGNQLAEKAG